MKNIKILPFIFFQLFCFFLFCNPSLSQKNHIKFERITTNEGLSQSTVLSIFQDSKGFMWFGTRFGLNRYDGYKFKLYTNNPDDIYSISHNNIKAILEDSKGNLWIGTFGGGLNLLDRKTEKFIHFQNDPQNINSISGNLINSILEDSQGNIWIGTAEGGLNLFDVENNVFIRFQNEINNPLSLSDNDVRDILEDGENNIWIATNNGGVNLLNRDKKSFIRFQHDENNIKSISHNSVWVLHEDNFQNLWIGTYGGGLDLFDRKNSEFKHHKKNENDTNCLNHNVITAISEDDEGNLYIGTENGGLNIYDIKNKTFSHYLKNVGDKNSLSDNSINSLFKDSKGNIWVGTFNGALNYVNRDANKFRHFKQDNSVNGLNENVVLSIYEDSKDNLWLGTDGGGLNLYDRKTGKFTHYMHEKGNKNSICGNFVLRVYEDKNFNLWVGTWADGLTLFNKEKNEYKHFKHNPNNSKSLSNNNCWAIFEDSQDNLWIGTLGGGLNLYNKKDENFIHFRHDPNNPNSIGSDKIYNLFEDSKGNLWIGTDGGGLNLFDRETATFKRFKKTEDKLTVNDNSVDCILEDKKGNLWLATDAGLSNFNTKTSRFTNYFIKDGLPSDVIMGILEDDFGNLWISTNKGVSKFNPDNKTFKNYTTVDGLQSNEFKEEAYCKSRSGAMYFGGINGFNEFYPEKIQEKSFDPPLLFTNFLIFNKEVAISQPNKLTPLKQNISETKDLTLSYKDEVLSFEFASINFTVPEKKQYAYMLEKFDTDWNHIGLNRTATYTNLDPGKYTLKVKGLNNEGEWSDKIAAIDITVTPPFWETWWFRVISGLFFIGTTIGIFKIRLNVIKQQKRSLEAQIKERTLEILKQKEELETQAEYLISANAELQEQKIEISNHREKIESLYDEVKESIRAAEVIQQSILPSETFFKKYLPHSFVLNKPKDVVSGDFYWFDVLENKIIVSVVDCTGHGVSGALMSIIGYHLLNQAIYQHEPLIASEILNRLNKGLIKELNQQEDKSINDGMDIALCIIDLDNLQLQYSGANNPLYVLRDNDIVQIKANKFSIGMTVTGVINSFTNNNFKLKKGDILYIFSDGYADQIGGATLDDKFMYHRFRELLINIKEVDIVEQEKILDQNLLDWRGSLEQLDDVLIIGIKI